MSATASPWAYLGTQPNEKIDVAGEYIREDVTETQAGVDLALDIQILDVNTCEPVPNVYMEIWRKSPLCL